MTRQSTPDLDLLRRYRKQLVELQGFERSISALAYAIGKLDEEITEAWQSSQDASPTRTNAGIVCDNDDGPCACVIEARKKSDERAATIARLQERLESWNKAYESNPDVELASLRAANASLKAERDTLASRLSTHELEVIGLISEANLKWSKRVFEAEAALADMTTQRDARPDISREDAKAALRYIHDSDQSVEDDPYGLGRRFRSDVYPYDRVRHALHAHGTHAREEG